jgi:hypothetical protein
MACETEDVKNTGLSNCNEFPILLSGMVETSDSFIIPAATIASGVAAVNTLLQAAYLVAGSGRIWNWPGFSLPPEDAAEEEVYQDSPLKLRSVRKGNQRWRFFISENLCLHKNLQTHKRTNGRVFLIDQNGYLIGTKKPNGDFAGLSLALLNPEKLKWATESEASTSPIYVALSNSGIQFDKNGYMLNMSDYVDDFYRIVDVNVTVVTITDAGDIDVLVATDCDSTGVSGLLVADFVYLDASRVAVTISTAVESSSVPGQYKLTQAGDLFVDGTVNIRSAALLTVKAYESTGAAAVNIP